MVMAVEKMVMAMEKMDGKEKNGNGYGKQNLATMWRHLY